MKTDLLDTWLTRLESISSLLSSRFSFIRWENTLTYFFNIWFGVRDSSSCEFPVRKRSHNVLQKWSAATLACRSLNSPHSQSEHPYKKVFKPYRCECANVFSSLVEYNSKSCHFIAVIQTIEIIVIFLITVEFFLQLHQKRSREALIMYFRGRFQKIPYWLHMESIDT